MSRPGIRPGSLFPRSFTGGFGGAEFRFPITPAPPLRSGAAACAGNPEAPRSFEAIGEVMAITVYVPPPLRAFCEGASELSLPAENVRAALAEIERRFPRLHSGVCDETGAVRRHLNLFVNTSHVRDRDGLDTALAPGDVLTILPAVSGGRSWQSG